MKFFSKIRALLLFAGCFLTHQSFADLTSVSPNPILLRGIGAPIDVTVTGTGFTRGDMLSIFDENEESVGFSKIDVISSTSGKARISLPAAGTYGFYHRFRTGPRVTVEAVDVSATITEVPNPAAGTATPQPFVIVGRGFADDATAQFRNLETNVTSTFPVTERLPDRITVSATFGEDNREWTVKVTNVALNVTGEEVAFTVYGPASTAPTLSTLEPAAFRQSGNPRTIAITGRHFGAAAEVVLRNLDTADTVVVPTVGNSISRSFDFSGVAGRWTAEVRNTSAGSSSAPVNIHVAPPVPQPTITTVLPTRFTGTVQRIYVFGAGFTPETVLAFGGRQARPLRWSPTSLYHVHAGALDFGGVAAFNPRDNGEVPISSDEVDVPGAPLFERHLTISGVSPSAGLRRSPVPQILNISGGDFAPGVRVFAQLYVAGQPSGSREELNVSNVSEKSLNVSGVFNPPFFALYNLIIENPAVLSRANELYTPHGEVVVGIDDSSDPDAPKITSVSPGFPIKGEEPQTFTIQGERFPANAVVVLTREGSDAGVVEVLSAGATQLVVQATVAEASNDYAFEVQDPATGRKSTFGFSSRLDPQAPLIATATPKLPDANPDKPLKITLTGTRFPADPVVAITPFGGQPIPVTVASSTATKIVFSALIEAEDNYLITVTDPDSGRAGSVEYQVYDPGSPKFTSVAPARPATSAARQTLTFTGARLPAPVAQLEHCILFDPEGFDVVDFQVVSAAATKLVVKARLDLPGQYNLVVQASGGAGAEFQFEVAQGTEVPTPPAITSLSPSPLYTSTGEQTLAVRGSGFQEGAQVSLFNATTSQVFSDVELLSATDSKLTFSLLFGETAGQWSVVVTNPDGLASSEFPFSVTLPPVPPTITGASPAPVIGSAASQELTLTGSGFEPGALVVLRDLVSGETFSKTPVALSSTSITASARFGTAARSWTAQVVNPDGGLSTAFPFAVVAPVGSTAPVITSISPDPVPGSGAAKLITIAGGNFGAGCTITLRDATAGLVFRNLAPKSSSATSLTISHKFGTAGHQWTAEVIAGTGESSGQHAFLVAGAANAPAISSVSPSPVPGSNSPQDLVIAGSGFSAGSKVNLRNITTGQTILNVPVVSREDGEIVIREIFTTAAHDWTVEIVAPVSGRKTASTGPFAFAVRTPAGKQPDLVASAVTFTALSSGSNATTVGFNIANIGPVASRKATVRLTLGSSDGDILPGDTVLGTITVEALPAGENVSFTWPVVLPPFTGTFHLAAAVVNVPDEALLDNNAAFSAPVTLGALPPGTTPLLLSMDPSPVPGSTLTQTVRLRGTNLVKGTKIRFTHTGNGTSATRATKVQANGDLTATMNFGAFASDWTATAIAPGGATSNDLRFNVADSANAFTLVFPLPFQTPESARLSTVFDHAMSAPYTAGDGVVTFTDERATVADTARGPIRTVKNVPLFAFTQPGVVAFSLGGLYDGPGSAAALSFDGNPGYMILVPPGTPVFATAAGRVYKGSARWDAVHTIYIDHGNGYRSYYLHCDTMTVKNGLSVQAGDLIARSGSAGTAEAGLHFEVRRQFKGKWIPVDPYGWTSAAGEDDPYTIPGAAVSGGVNTRLWAH